MQMKLLRISVALLATTTPAFAHHPLGGVPMETFAHGLLSGIGHPILGFDHLFFIIAVGVAALFTVHRRIAPAAYVTAMLLGCGLMSAGVALPFTDAMIALSLLVIGAILLSGRTAGSVMTLLLFAGFGLFHGSAFGESLATQEGVAGTDVLVGYLLGLGLTQYLVAFGAGQIARHMLDATRADAIHARLIGAMVAGVGAFLCLEQIERPVVALITG